MQLLLTFKYFWSVEAVEDWVEHDFRIVAIWVELGAEGVCVGYDPGVLSDDGVRGGVAHFNSALGGPSPLLEVLW